MQNIAEENEAAANIATAHAQVENAYTETAASVDAQVQEAIDRLPAPYEDWQNEAIAKIRELGRVAQLAYNSDKAPNQNDPAKSLEYLKKIKAAKGELETVVDGYVAKKAVEDAANTKAVAVVESLKGKLNEVVVALGDLPSAIREFLPVFGVYRIDFDGHTFIGQFFHCKTSCKPM